MLRRRGLVRMATAFHRIGVFALGLSSLGGCVAGPGYAGYGAPAPAYAYDPGFIAGGGFGWGGYGRDRDHADYDHRDYDHRDYDHRDHDHRDHDNRDHDHRDHDHWDRDHY